jgi:hypothetical protein
MRLGSLQSCAIAALVGLSCHTITEEMPENPSGVPEQPGPIPVVVVVPTTLPSAAPGNPQPTPAPDATPTPNPAPSSAPPSSTGCGVGPGPGDGSSNCRRASPSFLNEVENALDQLVREEPGIFDLHSTSGCGNCYKVLNVQRYVSRMPKLMQQRGLCSIFDGEELAVKENNDFADSYDILTASNYIRRQGGSYRVTCWPAWF